MKRAGRRPWVRPLAMLLMIAQSVFWAGPAAAADRVPDDTYFSSLWYLSRIGAPEAWNRSLGFEGIPIAIIDSGVDLDHPDLKDNIWRNADEVPNNRVDDDSNGYVDDVFGWDFVDRDNDPRPSWTSGDYNKLGASHGTINAGIAAAKGDNGRGVVGVTWQSTIMAIRALDSNGAGDPLDVVRAIEYAVANGAKVINLSFTGPAKNELLAIALRRAYDAGVFIVAAAGNAAEGSAAADLDREPQYPVCLDQDSSENFIYGVAATDEADKKAAFSNYGAGCVDISAPGTRILTTQLYRPASQDFANAYGGYFNGTSVAAPIVAGAVALLLALDHNLTPKQIMGILTGSALRIDSLNPEFFGKLGRGRLDIAKAVADFQASTKQASAETRTTYSLLPSGSGDLIVVAAPGPGRPPEVRLFTPDGIFIRGFEVFPSGFRGGVSLAIGDFDGNGRKTIVAGAGAGGGPHIRVFDRNTKNIGGFFAFDQRFTGGVSVAAGDVDGDGRDEIIAAAGRGGGPHVRIFRPNGTPIGSFFAFDRRFTGGVSVAAGDVDGDGRDEIIAAPGRGITTAVRVFKADGKLIGEFNPLGLNHKDGARLSVVDADRDGYDEIVVGSVRADGRTLGAYRLDGSRVSVLEHQASAVVQIYPETARTAIHRAAAVAGKPLSPATVTIRGYGANQFTFMAFEAAFKGGVAVGLIE